MPLPADVSRCRTAKPVLHNLASGGQVATPRFAWPALSCFTTSKPSRCCTTWRVVGTRLSHVSTWPSLSCFTRSQPSQCCTTLRAHPSFFLGLHLLACPAFLTSRRSPSFAAGVARKNNTHVTCLLRFCCFCCFFCFFVCCCC